MSLDVVGLDSLSRADIRSIALRELVRRAKISAAKKGVPKTPEHRAKIGAGKRAYHERLRAERALEAGESQE